MVVEVHPIEDAPIEDLRIYFFETYPTKDPAIEELHIEDLTLDGLLIVIKSLQFDVRLINTVTCFVNIFIYDRESIGMIKIDDFIE